MDEQKETPTPAVQVESKETPKDSDVEDNKVVASLSYFGILVFVPLFLKRDSPFCQFHAKQGIVFLMIWIVGLVVFWVPVIGWLTAVAVAIFNIYALVQAFQGEKWEAPIIADIAKKINV